MPYVIRLNLKMSIGFWLIFMGICCEHGNEISGFLKGEKLLD